MRSAAHKASAAEQPTLSLLARQALAECGGNTEVAASVITADLMADRKLLRSVIESAIADAVAYRVEHSMRSHRATVISRATAPGKSGVIALAKGISASLLDMPLANGVKLRDASRKQVMEQAHRYAALARDTGHKARWLTLIGQSIPSDKTVGEVLSDERATELWHAAETEGA